LLEGLDDFIPKNEYYMENRMVFSLLIWR